jgi:molybdopterin synthase sulfur carrier subunit
VIVRVRAFARARELLGSELQLELPDGASLADAWEALRLKNVELDRMASSIRLARNGVVSPLLDARLAEGDEVSVLPPVGGG